MEISPDITDKEQYNLLASRLQAAGCTIDEAVYAIQALKNAFLDYHSITLKMEEIMYLAGLFYLKDKIAYPQYRQYFFTWVILLYWVERRNKSPPVMEGG